MQKACRINLLTQFENEADDYSQQIMPLNPYAMLMDDDSCSCSLIRMKGARKDTNYSEERDIMSE